MNIFHTFFYHFVPILDFEQVNVSREGIQKHYYFQSFHEKTCERDLFLGKFSVLYLKIHLEPFFIHVREGFQKPAIFIKFNYLETLKIFAVVTDGQCSSVTSVRNVSLILEKL